MKRKEEEEEKIVKYKGKSIRDWKDMNSNSNECQDIQYNLFLMQLISIILYKKWNKWNKNYK